VLTSSSSSMPASTTSATTATAPTDIGPQTSSSSLGASVSTSSSSSMPASTTSATTATASTDIGPQTSSSSLGASVLTSSSSSSSSSSKKETDGATQINCLSVFSLAFSAYEAAESRKRNEATGEFVYYDGSKNTLTRAEVEYLKPKNAKDLKFKTVDGQIVNMEAAMELEKEGQTVAELEEDPLGIMEQIAQDIFRSFLEEMTYCFCSVPGDPERTCLTCIGFLKKNMAFDDFTQHLRNMPYPYDRIPIPGGEKYVALYTVTDKWRCDTKVGSTHAKVTREDPTKDLAA
jgi:hypothetical protein